MIVALVAFRSAKAAVLVFMIALLLPSLSRAQSTEPRTLREFMDAKIEQFTIHASEDAKEAAKVIVALRWANNARGSEDGMTLLYIHAGRPLATACIYPWDGRVVHDFQIMTTDKIVARQDDAIIWRPQSSTIEFADIPDAPAPAESAAQRLRQMKALAGEFQSTMLGWKADSTDREELRLLTKPLYRYEPPDDSQLLDGAVFAFAMGTDPESLLMIQAAKDKEGAQWQFAFARRTSGELEGRHKEKVVWNAKRFPREGDPTQPNFGIGTRIPPELLPQPTR